MPYLIHENDVSRIQIMMQRLFEKRELSTNAMKYHAQNLKVAIEQLPKVEEEKDGP